MMYDGYHVGGMHLIWWLIWIMFLLTIFASPYDIPGQRSKRQSPLDILKNRFASGQITNEEYHEKKIMLEKDSATQTNL